MGIESLKDWLIEKSPYRKYPWLNAPLYHAWQNKDVIGDKLASAGAKIVDKYQDFQQWQEDMGYYDSAEEQHSPTYDLLDKMGIVGTSGDAWNPETRGTGEKEGWLSQKLPAYWDASKDVAKEQGLSTLDVPAIMGGDARATVANLAKDWGWDWLVKHPAQMANEYRKYLYNKGLDVDRAIAEKYPWWSAGDKEKYKMAGWGAAGTWTQDNYSALMDFFGLQGISGPPTKMMEEAADTIGSNMFNIRGEYAPPRLSFKTVDGQRLYKDQTPEKEYDSISGEENWHPDTDLSNWTSYQYWKGGNWDNADDRRIQKRVNSRMDKFDWGPKTMYPLFLAEAQMPGREHYLDDKMHYYKEFVKRNKNDVRNVMMNRFEFEETGKDYGKWASKQYQERMVDAYGMYPLFADGAYFDENNQLTQEEALSQNISPFQDLTSNFELANEDYMKAVRSGKKPDEIGEPTEWNYGMFDTKTGVGLAEKDWMKYSSPKAREFWQSPQMQAIEMGGFLALRAPQAIRFPLQKWLQTTGAGRILREIAPGTLQWGKQSRFGLPKMYEGNKVADWLWNYPTKIIDKLRPKGLQAGIILERSEALGPFDRGAYEYE